MYICVYTVQCTWQCCLLYTCRFLDTVQWFKDVTVLSSGGGASTSIHTALCASPWLFWPCNGPQGSPQSLHTCTSLSTATVLPGIPKEAKPFNCCNFHSQIKMQSLNWELEMRNEIHCNSCYLRSCKNRVISSTILYVTKIYCTCHCMNVNSVLHRMALSCVLSWVWLGCGAQRHCFLCASEAVPNSPEVCG